MPTIGDATGAARKRLLCIFARVPLPGRVKRRLAADLGEQGALQAHRHLVERTLRRCVNPGSHASELWIAAGPADHPDVRSWLARYPLTLQRQTGADLGARMWRALAAGLNTGRHTIVVGADCPMLDVDYLRQAFNALESHDLVLGPAEDGGYGLVGLSRSLPEIFDEIPWGGREVLARTLARADKAGAGVRLLPQIYDVDCLADWERYQKVRTAPV